MFKGFILGGVTLALFASVGSAYAAGKLTNISVVQGGIKLFVDGKFINPTDSDGKVVEPFIYDGTTYLPLRALSDALTNYQKQVKWDGDTSSIYVGQAPVAAQTDILQLKPYENNGYIYKNDADAIITILDKTITPFNRLRGSYSGESYTYMLNSKYSQINGQFVIPYEKIGSNGKAKIQFYNVNKKGVETLIKEFTTTTGDEPVQISVDVRGVEILKINTPYNDATSTFYNVTLAGI
jgi:hypothetical protein